MLCNERKKVSRLYFKFDIGFMQRCYIIIHINLYYACHSRRKINIAFKFYRKAKTTNKYTSFWSS
jgi:hypothetical protein